MTTKVPQCPAEVTLQVIGGRWKTVILYHLYAGAQRFSDLRRAIPNVTQKMLTQQLRELEKDGIIHRKVFAVVPPKVEYSLTPVGRTLKPVIGAMCKWGNQNGDARKAG